MAGRLANAANPEPWLNVRSTGRSPRRYLEAMRNRPTPLALFALGCMLFVAACGGGKSETPAATSDGSTSGPGTPSQAGGTTAAGTAASTTQAAAPATAGGLSPAALPTPTSAQIADFTNGILGDGQQPLYWMQTITGDRECGSTCDRSVAVRWQTLSNLCTNGRWEARRSEIGYSEKVHGEAITALIESCAIVAKHYASGTPVDDETWQGYANEALNRLWPAMDSLLEAPAGG